MWSVYVDYVCESWKYSCASKFGVDGSLTAQPKGLTLVCCLASGHVQSSQSSQLFHVPCR
jgi:hypothetical protein